jgi:hypothetical protein
MPLERCGQDLGGRLTGVRFDGEKPRRLQSKSTRFEHGNRLILSYQRASDQASAKGRWANET